MDIEKITELAYKNMAKRKAHVHREIGYLFYHCQRVAKMSVQIREMVLPLDASLDDVIYVGALFHDVAKGLEPHHLRGAVLVKDILKGECSIDELDAVSEVVRGHNQRGVPGTPDHVKIVQDADMLDHFGGMEIWLKFMYSARNEESVFDAIKAWKSAWFKNYIQESREALNFEIARQHFDERLRFQQLFVERFIKEAYADFTGIQKLVSAGSLRGHPDAP